MRWEWHRVWGLIEDKSARTFPRESPANTGLSSFISRTYARYSAPAVYSPSLHRHRATRDERAMGQDRVMGRSLPVKVKDRIVRADICARGPAQVGAMIGTHRGAKGRIYRPIAPERRRDRQSRCPIPCGNLNPRVAAARRRASMFADHPRRGQASPLQLSCPKGEEHLQSRGRANPARASARPEILSRLAVG